MRDFIISVICIALIALCCGCSTPGTSQVPVSTQGAQTIGGSQGTAQGTEGVTSTNVANHIPILAAQRVVIGINGGTTTVEVTGGNGEIAIAGQVALDQKVEGGSMTSTASSGGQQGASAGSGTGGASTGNRAPLQPFVIEGNQ